MSEFIRRSDQLAHKISRFTLVASGSALGSIGGIVISKVHESGLMTQLLAHPELFADPGADLILFTASFSAIGLLGTALGASGRIPTQDR